MPGHATISRRMAARPLILAVTAAALAVALVSCGDDEADEAQAVQEAQETQIAQIVREAQESQDDAWAEGDEAQEPREDDEVQVAQQDDESLVAQEAQITVAPATTATVTDPDGAAAVTELASDSDDASEQRSDSAYTATLEVVGPTDIRLGETVTLRYSTPGSEYRSIRINGLHTIDSDLSQPDGTVTDVVEFVTQRTFFYVLHGRWPDGTTLERQVTLTITDPLPALSRINVITSPFDTDLPELDFDGDRLDPAFDPDVLFYTIRISYSGVLPESGASWLLTVTATAADGYEVSESGTPEYGQYAYWTPRLRNDDLNALTPGGDVRTTATTIVRAYGEEAAHRTVVGGMETLGTIFHVRSLENPSVARAYSVHLEVRRR